MQLLSHLQDIWAEFGGPRGGSVSYFSFGFGGVEFGSPHKATKDGGEYVGVRMSHWQMVTTIIRWRVVTDEQCTVEVAHVLFW
jgi:hypothetical protein